MRRIIVSEFLTLDGVMEAPEKWSFPFQNEEVAQFKYEEILSSDVLLLGKTTYQIFANSWPSRKGDFADRMNSIPKYVVSTTLDQLTWHNSYQFKDANCVVEEIIKLKQQAGQDILVAGSGRLVQMLIQQRLVDEYRFLVHPLFGGSGKRLFAEECQATLKLIQARSFSTGMILLQYQPAGK
ncbi:MAG TPA: dihydrofolate reductase family protein [Anaerolineales bacterium]|nr:dihydrofolate reductase family protein [Anaerolineales bacterium]